MIWSLLTSTRSSSLSFGPGVSPHPNPEVDGEWRSSGLCRMDVKLFYILVLVLAGLPRSGTNVFCSLSCSSLRTSILLTVRRHPTLSMPTSCPCPSGRYRVHPSLSFLTRCCLIFSLALLNPPAPLGGVRRGNLAGRWTPRRSWSLRFRVPVGTRSAS